MISSLLATIVMTLAAAAPQGSEKKLTSDSLLAIGAIKVDASRRGPDTLFRLKLRLRNKGQRTAYGFAFKVELNGQPVAFHSNHVWALAPGKDTEVQLYNILTSEPGRPVPNDGRLVVEVHLTAARWQSSDDSGARTQHDNVEPLPEPRSITRTISTRKRN